ncbi:MAG TPA: universal stress protein [Bryobacteraceae bacterium]|nr:universal stress protein [Bryobacteraceae bacterium]
MPQIRKILFPVDFSDSSLGAARYVEYFAGQFQAEIMLLHAVGMGEHNLAEELLPQRKARLDAFLADELKYFTTERVCVTGDAATALMDTAAAWNPDLVMIPTHGLGYFRRHLLGSVTAKALHDLRCPVWTSVHAEVAPTLENIHCRRILCAVDLTERSSFVLQWAAWLARECDATLEIVHATPSLDASAQVWAMAEEFQQSVRDRAHQDLATLQKEAGTNAEGIVAAGVPAAVIAGAAKEFAADLLVIGRHDSEGFAGALFQNAYAILSQSPCPVISV